MSMSIRSRRHFLGSALGVLASSFPFAGRLAALRREVAFVLITPRPAPVLPQQKCSPQNSWRTRPRSFRFSIRSSFSGDRGWNPLQVRLRRNRGFYSLLSCYEGDGMTPFARFAGRRPHGGAVAQGRKSLDQIREAIDARWG